MNRNLILISLFICMTGFSSCSGGRSAIKSETIVPLVALQDQLQKYNFQLDFRKHHFSGMLLVRKITEEETRMVFTTYFGLSIFDFSFIGDSFVINSCIEPMRKKNILKLMESDLRSLFLPDRGLKHKNRSELEDKYRKGRGLAKSGITVSGFEQTRSQPSQIKIKHSLIGLRIQLDKLHE